MSLIEKCRDLTEPPTLFSLAQSIYLWSLCDSLEKLGEDHSIEKYYLDSKLARFTGHASLGDIERMYLLEARYVSPTLLYSMSRRDNRAYINISGMNVEIRVRYEALNVPLDNLLPQTTNNKFLLSKVETLTQTQSNKFVYFQSKQQDSKTTKKELQTQLEKEFATCIACQHPVQTYTHIQGHPEFLPVRIGTGQDSIRNMFDTPLDVSYIVENLQRDMRFSPKHQRSKKVS